MTYTQREKKRERKKERDWHIAFDDGRLSKMRKLQRFPGSLLATNAFASDQNFHNFRLQN